MTALEDLITDLCAAIANEHYDVAEQKVELIQQLIRFQRWASGIRLNGFPDQREAVQA